VHAQCCPISPILIYLFAVHSASINPRKLAATWGGSEKSQRLKKLRERLGTFLRDNKRQPGPLCHGLRDSPAYCNSVVRVMRKSHFLCMTPQNAAARPELPTFFPLFVTQDRRFATGGEIAACTAPSRPHAFGEPSAQSESSFKFYRFFQLSHGKVAARTQYLSATTQPPPH
jgi:hypothetical protein